MTELPWIDIPPGSIILGKDGYQWEVTAVGRSEKLGTISVTMTREGRGEMTGTPPIGAMVSVVKLGQRQSTEDAVKLLKDALGAEVAECGWCSGDPSAECICDFNCGRKGCVNF